MSEIAVGPQVAGRRPIDCMNRFLEPPFFGQKVSRKRKLVFVFEISEEKLKLQ